MNPKNFQGVRYTSASEYNRRITLLNPATGTDSAGGALPPVQFATDVPAKISAFINAGRPEVTQQEVNNVNFYFVTVRYDSRITNSTTILSPNGQTWQITSLQDLDYAHVEWRMTVREQNGGVLTNG